MVIFKYINLAVYIKSLENQLIYPSSSGK